MKPLWIINRGFKDSEKFLVIQTDLQYKPQLIFYRFLRELRLCCRSPCITINFLKTQNPGLVNESGFKSRAGYYGVHTTSMHIILTWGTWLVARPPNPHASAWSRVISSSSRIYNEFITFFYESWIYELNLIFFQLNLSFVFGLY